MAAQQGFQYEKNAADFLKKLKLVPASFQPAGAGSDVPDLVLQYKKNTAGCELKITDASAGSLVLKYTPKAAKPWSFNVIDPNDTEKYFITQVAAKVKLLDQINKTWKDEPYKVDAKYQDPIWKAKIGKLTKEQQYRRDLETFTELKGNIPATEIEKYYNEKDTFYVNVGTHGFYMMGRTNPFGLIGVPLFSSAATAGWRARVQYKGGGNYQFTFEMNFKMKVKSPYNIAPITKNSVAILESQANVSCFK